MLVNTNSGRIRVKLVKNTSGGTLAPGVLVMPDVAGNIDTDVVLCGASGLPCGIVDPYLPSAVPAGAMFLMVKEASRVLVTTGAAYSKGVGLRQDAAGKAIAGTSEYMRALEASTGANQAKAVSCYFGSVGVGNPNEVKAARFVVTTAQLNAGITLLPALSGIQYRLHDASFIAVGGAVTGATLVDLNATQGASSVKLVSNAVAALTQNTLLRAGAANSNILAGGASFAPCDTNTAVNLAAVGTAATATHVHVLLTYEMVSG
jgi:hypothetical protein